MEREGKDRDRLPAALATEPMRLQPKALGREGLATK